MNKKYILGLCFVCQLAGILLVNYLIKEQPELVQSLEGYFNFRDKLEYVNRNELAIYLFLKRLKQGLCFSLFYIYISPAAAIVASCLYLVFMQGFMMSLIVYIHGAIGILKGFLLILIPIYVKILVIVCLIINKQKNIYKAYNKKYKLIVFTIVYALIESYLEMNINSAIYIKIFTDT